MCGWRVLALRSPIPSMCKKTRCSVCPRVCAKGHKSNGKRRQTANEMLAALKKSIPANPSEIQLSSTRMNKLKCVYGPQWWSPAGVKQNRKRKLPEEDSVASQCERARPFLAQMTSLMIGMFVQFVGGMFAEYVRIKNISDFDNKGRNRFYDNEDDGEDIDRVLEAAKHHKILIYNELQKYLKANAESDKSSLFDDISHEQGIMKDFFNRAIACISTLIELEYFPIFRDIVPYLGDAKWVTVDRDYSPQFFAVTGNYWLRIKDVEDNHIGFLRLCRQKTSIVECYLLRPSKMTPPSSKGFKRLVDFHHSYVFPTRVEVLLSKMKRFCDKCEPLRYWVIEQEGYRRKSIHRILSVFISCVFLQNIILRYELCIEQFYNY